jgi:hypothetical protein
MASMNVYFDNLNAYSLDDPKIAAVGDIACSSTSGSFNSGNGSSTQCQQRYTSDLICGTTPATCDTADNDAQGTGYDKVLGLGDLQYNCGDFEEYAGDSGTVDTPPNPPFPSAPFTASWDARSAAPALQQISWSRISNTSNLFRPTAGNHEYYLSGESGVSNCTLNNDGTGTATNQHGACYFEYFDGGTGNGDAGSECTPTLTSTGQANPDGRTFTNNNTQPEPAGYYSFDTGNWRIIGLNSGSGSGCKENSFAPLCSTQRTYLEGQLDSNTQACTLVYWHHARWSSGTHGNNPGATAGQLIQKWWDTMYDGTATDPHASSANPDIALAGHDHLYERFAKASDVADASGSPTAASDGIREFVVGTGGEDHDATNSLGRDNNSEALNDTTEGNATFGILELVLHSNSYQYRFRPATPSGVSNGTYKDPSNGQLSAPVQCNN